MQTNYCRLTNQELSDKEYKSKATIFDPQQPVNLIFNKIKVFTDLCVTTGNDKSNRQIVQIVYFIFNRTRAYIDSLKVWNDKSQADWTYPNFQTHLRNEFYALRQVGALKIENSSLNMLKDIINHQNQLSDNLGAQLNATMKANFMEAFKLLQTDMLNDENTRPQPSALNLQILNIDMMTMLATMQKNIDTLTERLAATAQNLGINTPSGTLGTQTNKIINPKTGRSFKLYCCTCGCCPHWGRNCYCKATEHKDDATLKDHKHGSDENCIPNRSWMVRGAVKQQRVLNWLTSLITCYTKPLIYSIASTIFLPNHNVPNIAKEDSGATFHF